MLGFFLPGQDSCVLRSFSFFQLFNPFFPLYFLVTEMSFREIPFQGCMLATQLLFLWHYQNFGLGQQWFHLGATWH